LTSLNAFPHIRPINYTHETPPDASSSIVKNSEKNIAFQQKRQDALHS